MILNGLLALVQVIFFFAASRHPFYRLITP
jgi:hypothetical protein